MLIRLNAETDRVSKIVELVQNQKLSFTQFLSASSNSAIGLATSNWDLLLSERKIIIKQIKRYESFFEEVQKALLDEKVKIPKTIPRLLNETTTQWEEVKRLNVVILRTKNSELVNNEALPIFINKTKEFLATFQNFEIALIELTNQKREKAKTTEKYFSYFNITFQLTGIPILIFFIFIPGIKRAQELESLRANQVSLSKLSALGEMAGGVAHEINTPLAVIRLTSEQLHELLTEEEVDTKSVIQLCMTIEKTVDRIAKIVKGLRAFSRDGSNDPFQRINVGQLIEETVSFCRERYQNNNVKLNLDTVAEDLTFEGRETEISQVLLNLLNNAYDAIENLKEKWVSVSVSDQNDWIEISVTDCGLGISTEAAQKIFQPFYTSKDIGKGTGLGLSVSLGIVKNHGGSLTVDCKKTNTCFIVRLPKKQEQGRS